MVNSVPLVIQDAARLIERLRLSLRSNTDGHLGIADCSAINDAITLIGEFMTLYPDAVTRAKANEDNAEYNASLVIDAYVALAEVSAGPDWTDFGYPEWTEKHADIISAATPVDLAPETPASNASLSIGM